MNTIKKLLIILLSTCSFHNSSYAMEGYSEHLNITVSGGQVPAWFEGAVERSAKAVCTKHYNIFKAIHDHDLERVKECVREWPSNLNVRNELKQTPLIFATLDNQIEIVRFLIKAGADLNRQDKWGYTALIIAARDGFLAIKNDLIKAGAATDLEADLGVTCFDFIEEIQP